MRLNPQGSEELTIKLENETSAFVPLIHETGKRDFTARQQSAMVVVQCTKEGFKVDLVGVDEGRYVEPPEVVSTFIQLHNKLQLLAPIASLLGASTEFAILLGVNNFAPSKRQLIAVLSMKPEHRCIRLYNGAKLTDIRLSHAFLLCKADLSYGFQNPRITGLAVEELEEMQVGGVADPDTGEVHIALMVHGDTKLSYLTLESFTKEAL